MTKDEAARYFARQRDILIWGLDNKDETRQAHDAYNCAISALISRDTSPEVIELLSNWDSLRATKLYAKGVTCLAELPSGVYVWDSKIPRLSKQPGASPETDGRAGGWVRTSERMPTKADADKDDHVLVVTAFGNIQICHYEEECGGYEYGLFYPYWMPLPALPEVEP